MSLAASYEFLQVIIEGLAADPEILLEGEFRKHDVANVAHQVNPSPVAGSEGFVRTDEPATSWQQMPPLPMVFQTPKCRVHVAEAGRFPRQNLKKGESQPGAARTRIASQNYVLGFEPNVTPPNDWRADFCGCYLMPQTAKKDLGFTRTGTRRLPFL